MKRYQQILVVILVVQLVLIGLVYFWPKPEAVASQPLFPELKREDVASLTVTGSDGATLRMVKAGETWSLPDAGGYPVLVTKVESALDTLLGLKTDRLVAQTAANQARLQVAPTNYALRIELGLTGGATRTLYVGTSPTYGSSHVRVDGQEQIYLEPNVDSYTFGPEAGNWVDTSWIALTPGSINQVTLENVNGRLVLVQEQGGWKIPAAELNQVPDETKIQQLISQLETISMLAPLGTAEKPEYGMDKPQAVITLKTLENKTVTLKIGSGDATGFVAWSSESPYYVRVSVYQFQELVQTSLADWVTVSEVAPDTGDSAVVTETLPITSTTPLSTTVPVTPTEVVTP